jgi:hypothetical protein
MRECRGLKTAFGGEPSKKPRRYDDADDNQGGDRDKGPAFQEPSKTITTIFGGCATHEDKRDHKLVAQRIKTAATYDGPIADPKFLPWSEHPITFSKADQWTDIPYPGWFPLIMDPITKDVRFRKVLIDSGSALNILFFSVMKELGLRMEDLTPTDSPFWGIVPGKASLPLGQVTLKVQFGTNQHFHVDNINFLVADFDTAYHAIHGRPALAKFMAVPHYTYLVLKMPTEQGVLSLCANLDVAYSCERESFALAEATDISICIQDYLAAAKQVSPQDAKILTKEAPRAATKNKEVKEVNLIIGDPTKTAQIGSNLDPK